MLLGVAVGVALRTGDEATPSSTATPVQTITLGGAPLHAARLLAAKGLAAPPVEVDLASLREAGWDGCLGVRIPGRPCTELFVAGAIAIFRVDDREARFHLAGDRAIGPIVANDHVQIDDGLPLPPDLALDTFRWLAGYAAGDLALRLGLNPDAVAVIAIVPAPFDGCLGFHPAGRTASCTKILVEGAIVIVAQGEAEYTYHVSRDGVIAVSFLQGVIVAGPDAAVLRVQRAMRADLEKRLRPGSHAVTLTSYRAVTWPSGCLGASKPGDVCTQALVPGFLAILTAGGREYRYHGAGEAFISVSFEPGLRITDPIP